MMNNNINEFKKLGATCIRQALNSKELDLVQKAISENIRNPSPMFDSFETSSGEPLFFNDFNNWRRIEKIKDICFSKKLATIAKSLMQANSVHLFHDHVIVKKKNSCLKTPWHIDKSYFMVDGEHTVSIWIPTHDVSKHESLIFAKGSHLGKKLYVSKDFKSNNNLEISNDFQNYTENDIKKNFQTISWEMKKGDLLAFSYYTLHMAPEIKFNYDREALSIRYFGNDTTFDGRVKNPAPPFTQIGYRGEHGDPINPRWFPEIELD